MRLRLRLRLRRYVLFFTLLLTLTTVGSAAPAAHAWACNHVWNERVTNRYLHVDASEHELRRTTRKACRICGYFELDTERIFQEHREQLYNLGHNYADHTHSYRAGCSQCGYTVRLQTIPCPDLPCPEARSPRSAYELQCCPKAVQRD